MKIIQSFWSGKNKNVTNAYGWYDYHYHWLSWMLSCHQLRKFYDQVELYTDEFGYDILINKLKLPYTKVHVVLDVLNEYHPDLWAIAKIYTYSLQDEPFLHVDGDVFIFEAFSEELMQADLITQNQEITTNYYREMWNKIAPHLTYLPIEMEDFHNEVSNLAFNMGIFGGNDVAFLKQYSEKSLMFVQKNKISWEKINLHNFNVFFEQVLFYECTKIEHKEVDVLIKEDIGDNEYQGFANFDEVPEKETYLHLLGVFKQSELVCRKMEQFCLYHHPEFIKALKSIVPEKYENLNYSFTQEENQELIKWYKTQLFEEEITPKRLLARDLYTFGQIKFFESLENSQKDYYLISLKEFEIIEQENNKVLFLKTFHQEHSFVKNVDAVDEVVLYELTDQPIKKSDLLKNLEDYLEEDFNEEDIKQFKKTIDSLLSVFTYLGLIAVFNEKPELLTTTTETHA